MRDQLKDEAYFNDYIAVTDQLNAKREERIADPNRSHDDQIGFTYDRFRDSCHKASAAYSAGRPIPEVKAMAVAAIDALAPLVALAQEDVDHFLHGNGGGYSGNFDQWYRILAWCVLFDLPRPKTDIVLDYLSIQMRNPETATDALVNRFVKHLGYPGQNPTDHLIWPEAYAGLYECFTTHESYRAHQLADFMKSWYKNMGDAYWYDRHKNKHDTYFGYWCFEAAAVAKMLEIDDKALADHPNYPFEARSR